jgi:hypothetical protein
MANKKNKIHKTDLHTMWIGGETLLEPPMVAPLTPTTLSSLHHDKKGSSSSLDYETVEVSCINLFQCATLGTVTRAAYHDCDYIFITPVVDLLLFT